MDLQATSLIAILKNPNVSTDQKNDYLVKFKTFIKHHQVPLDAMASSFEAIRIAISHPQQAEGGFSTLSHLLKRLQLQNNQSIIVSLAPKTFPVLLERLSESKDRMQIRSINAFAELWNSSPTEVEEVMRDKALTAKKSSRQKQGAMMWVVKVG
jgi:CLIP-associating protein 1/2